MQIGISPDRYLGLIAPVIVLLALLGTIAVAQRIHHTLQEMDGKG